MMQRLIFLMLVLGLSACGQGRAPDDAIIAVATNFAGAAAELEATFEDQNKYNISIATGATGHLYGQIVQGAPYDAFLAADQKRPQALIDNGLAAPDTAFTYAIGHLVLWSPERAVGAHTLKNGKFRKLAMANPDLAPYGLAARQYLDSIPPGDILMGEPVKDRTVYGQTAGQAYGLVISGNADLGLVAFSSLKARSEHHEDYWPVPASLYDPIKQDAVLLARGKDNPAARAFLDFLKSQPARDILIRYGYSGL